MRERQPSTAGGLERPTNAGARAGSSDRAGSGLAPFEFTFFFVGIGGAAVVGVLALHSVYASWYDVAYGSNVAATASTAYARGFLLVTGVAVALFVALTVARSAGALTSAGHRLLVVLLGLCYVGVSYAVSQEAKWLWQAARSDRFELVELRRPDVFRLPFDLLKELPCKVRLGGHIEVYPVMNQWLKDEVMHRLKQGGYEVAPVNASH